MSKPTLLGAARLVVIVFAATGALLHAPLAGAATLYFSPTTDVTSVETGDVIVVDVIADFTGEPTRGGGFDVAWDTSSLSFVNLDYMLVGEPSFGREPDLELANGRLFSWAFGAFDGISGVNLLGTVSFEVLDTMGPSTALNFTCQGLHSCFFLSSDDFLTEIPTARAPLEITRVPVPAAFWLLLSGVLALPRVKASRSI